MKVSILIWLHIRTYLSLLSTLTTKYQTTHTTTTKHSTYQEYLLTNGIWCWYPRIYYNHTKYQVSSKLKAIYQCQAQVKCKPMLPPVIIRDGDLLADGLIRCPCACTIILKSVHAYCYCWWTYLSRCLLLYFPCLWAWPDRLWAWPDRLWAWPHWLSSAYSHIYICF